MKKMQVFAALLLALCLAWTAAPAEEEDFTGIAGVWYTEDIMMTVTEEGRFVLGWNDGDWTGTLEAEPRTDEEGEEVTAYRLNLDDPEQSFWEEVELVPDFYHPEKLTLWGDGNPGEIFWNVPVSVADMSEEELEYYEPYALIDAADGQEPAVTVMFTFLRPAADIAVLRMFDQEIDDEGNLAYNADALEWWEALDSQERIVVTHVFEGDLPDLGITFRGEDGTVYDFAVQISGADGELELWPLLESNG